MRAILICWLSLASVTLAAPVPFPKLHHNLGITKSRMIRTWIVTWGSVNTEIECAPNGDYKCYWPGAVYTGTWGVDGKGIFWITESNQPAVSTSWQTYGIKFDPVTFKGNIVVGPTGIAITFKPK